MHKKVISEGEKIPAMKFNEANIIAARMSCGKNSGEEMKWRNWTRPKNHARKFNAAKRTCGEISGTENASF